MLRGTRPEGHGDLGTHSVSSGANLSPFQANEGKGGGGGSRPNGKTGASLKCAIDGRRWKETGERRSSEGRTRKADSGGRAVRGRSLIPAGGERNQTMKLWKKYGIGLALFAGLAHQASAQIPGVGAGAAGAAGPAAGAAAGAGAVGATPAA